MHSVVVTVGNHSVFCFIPAVITNTKHPQTPRHTCHMSCHDIQATDRPGKGSGRFGVQTAEPLQMRNKTTGPQGRQCQLCGNSSCQTGEGPVQDHMSPSGMHPT